MKIAKMPIHIFILVVSIYFFSPTYYGYAQESNFSNKEGKIDLMTIYYVDPAIINHPPISVDDIKSRSDHEIIIGNKNSIKQLRLLFDRIIEKQNKPDGIHGSVTLHVNFIIFGGWVEKWYVDTNQNFRLVIFSKTEDKIIFGKIPKKLYDQLIQFCESHINIIDYSFQNNRIYQNSGQFCYQDKGKNKETINRKCK